MNRRHDRPPTRITVIGAGINGLVAANYLARAGYSVTLLERNPVVGGACAKRTITIEGKKHDYPGGASVFGFMQDFVYDETGLAKRLTIHRARVPYAMLYDRKPDLAMICGDSWTLMTDAKKKWNEHGDIKGFMHDMDKVVAFLRKGYRAGKVPTVQDAEQRLGKETTRLWITGTGRDLVNHYFTSDSLKLLTLIPVNESGPVSIDAPFSAFNIPLMNSGSVFKGKWGFVKGGIWNVARELGVLNRDAGVRTVTSATVTGVDDATGTVTYRKNGKQKEVSSDIILFATEPLHAAALLKDQQLLRSISKKKLLGTSGKLIMFFKKPVRWKDAGPDDAMFRFVFYSDTVEGFQRAALSVAEGKVDFEPGYLEVYPEGAAQRQMGVRKNDDMLAIYFKHLALGKTGEELTNAQAFVEETILTKIENPTDFLKSVLITPADLQRDFAFAQGNIDHVEIESGQTYFSRTYSANPKESFFQFGAHPHVYYCGAGTYPCGSIAGTPGYMCAKQIMRKWPSLRR